MKIMEYFRRVFKRGKNIGSESAKFYLDEGSSKEQNNITNEPMNNKQKHSTHVKNATDDKIGGRLVAVVPKSEVIKLVRQKKIANGEKIRPDYPANGEELAEVIAYSLRYMDEIKEKWF